MLYLSQGRVMPVAVAVSSPRSVPRPSTHLTPPHSDQYESQPIPAPTLSHAHFILHNTFANTQAPRPLLHSATATRPIFPGSAIFRDASLRCPGRVHHRTADGECAIRPVRYLIVQFIGWTAKLSHTGRVMRIRGIG